MASRQFDGQRQQPFRRQFRINNDTLWQPPEPGQPVVFVGHNGVWYRTYWPHGRELPDNVKRKEQYEIGGRSWHDLPWLPR